jgi:5-formyltetrahydrofolate cyclo-ligase
MHQYWFKHSQKVAVYLASDGEIDCNAIIQTLLRQDKQVYLPVLHPITHRQLLFVQYDANTPMRYNRFGIKEPQLKRSRIVPAQALDIILMPLVGFDASGNRLGMGGGFYDTSLEKVVNSGWNKTPMRVGLAHNCQQVSHLPKEPWDVPLNQVITPDFVLSVK